MRTSAAVRREFWYGAGAAVAVFVVVLGCALIPQLWEWFGVGLLSFHFADLYALLAASDAHAAGLDPYAIPSPFDPLGRPHVYGPWWLWMHLLGITRADTVWLGIALGACSIVAFVALLRPSSVKQSVAAALLLASPPLLLSYERGNNDLIVVLLLAGAGVAGATRFGGVVQVLLIWTGAILKIYPLAALPLLAVNRTWRRAALGVAITLLLVVSAVWFWRSDFSTVINLVPRPQTYYGFGLKVIGGIWTAIQPESRIYFMLGVLVAIAAIIWSRGWQAPSRGAVVEGMPGAWLVAGGAAWIFCFVTNANFPYRVALLVLVAAAWFKLWRGKGAGADAGARLVLLLLVMSWMRFVRIALVFLFEARGQGLGVFTYGLEHGLAFGLSAIVLLSLGEWAWQTLQRWRREWRAEFSG